MMTTDETIKGSLGWFSGEQAEYTGRKRQWKNTEGKIVLIWELIPMYGQLRGYPQWTIQEPDLKDS